MMTPLAILRELFAYNYWARDRQIEACAVLTEEQLQRSLGSSFSSLLGTLVHMVGAEWIWLERCRGRSPQSLPSASEFPTLEAIVRQWRRVEEDFREYLAGLNDEVLLQPLSYAGLTGEIWTYPLWRVLVHVVNHQTYHRGQVTTLLRQLGLTPRPVDLLVAEDMGLFRAEADGEADVHHRFDHSHRRGASGLLRADSAGDKVDPMVALRYE